MSIPSNYINDLIISLSQSRIDNLIAQTDARRILQEVQEISENYPKFDLLLTEKATHVAYALLTCGCSLIENGDESNNEGFLVLEKAGKILSDAFKYNPDEVETKDYNLLIAGMALYSAKQYSRAFIVLNDVHPDFLVGQMVVRFIKKDFATLLKLANSAFFAQTSKQLDIREFDEWIISHEIARCFLVITDFIHTGNQENFDITNDILSKLLMLTFHGNLTLYWLIVRLLKIIFSTFQDSSLWSILLQLLPDGHITSKYIRLLGGFNSPVTELWPSQIVALPLAVGKNSGAIINLRTSGGKTRVAEIAILNTLSTEKMSKVLYLAPFRSLAFEIEQSLNKTFGPLGICVSQLYGGSTVNVTDFELIDQSQVIIATPEKAKALIRCGSGIESEIKLIVVDEGHLLGAEERYIRNEMFLTHINEYASRNQIRMLLLSAVLPNASDLAQWITDDANLVAKSEWKPALERLGLLLWDGNRVRLEWKSDGEPFNPNFVHKQPLGFGSRRNHFPNNKKEAVAATAVRLSQAGTVMIYSARANSIEGLAESVLLALGENPKDFDWDQSLWKVFQCVCAEELSDSDIILKAAKKGVICHNNRLPSLVRIAIERLMRSKSPLIIIASSTLGQGVNVGISTVIVSTPYYSNETISNRDFWNICGRAGRAFSDVEGKILYAIDMTEKQWQIDKNKHLAKNYFDNQQMETVKSGLLEALRGICRVSKRTNTDLNLLVEAISNDFIDTDIQENFIKLLNDIFDYVDDELLAMHEEFSENDEIAWIDDVFRKSLAIIQAEVDKEGDYINLLRARTTALLNRIPNKSIRKKLIASGVPLSISKLIFENADYFRTLASEFIQSFEDERNQVEIIDETVREIEIWSNKHAQNLMNAIPDQAVLDKIRSQWIGGVSLSQILKLESEASAISKDYYGFTLPWIIHAISQMFDKEYEENIAQVYTKLAMFVELGLPNSVATNIYMAGVRSRSTSIELSTFELFKDKGVSEIKHIVLNFPSQEMGVSESTIAWIELFAKSASEQESKKIFFPNFTWRKAGLPDKLYIRGHEGEYYLTSSEGYFCERIDSTVKLPFSEIANIGGLYFESSNNVWRLKSYNPTIVTMQCDN